jgi:predicted nuclease of predicted toxin-antitoxin system
MGVSLRTVGALRTRGHDVVHLREKGLQTLPDDQILELARNDGQVVLTFDLDFGDLLAAGGESGPSAVIVRLQNQTPDAVTSRLVPTLEQCEAELRAGAVVIVEESRYRLRRLPIRRL